MLIKNAHIVTFDNDNRIIENGYLYSENGLIKEIGDMEELNVADDEVINAKGKLLMPGFICTHTHIYSAFARGMILNGKSPSDFLQVLEGLWWRMDKKLTHEDIYYSALVTIIDCIKNGVTCIFDHHAGPNSIDGSLDVLEDAFIKLNMRGTLCYEVSDRDGFEIAGKGIHENSRFIIKKQNDKEDMVKGLFGLHAAFTLSNETLEKASEEGNSLGAGFHVHAAEGVYDAEYNRSKYGKGVVERLNDFSILNNKSILAHCIHLNDSEKGLLHKCNVVHNPESNMNNAVGYCDVMEFIKGGILVGLGSDGFSQNPFRAMDTCYVLHKHEKHDPRVMNPYDVITLSILNNSKIASKFYNNTIGKIRKDAKCDLILLDYDSPTPINKNNICGHIIFGMNSNMITHTIINGKVVMQDRKITLADESEIMARSREVAQKLWNRI